MCITGRTEQLLNIQSHTLHIYICDKYTGYVSDMILVIGNTCIIVNGIDQLNYNDTLQFVPTIWR